MNAKKFGLILFLLFFLGAIRAQTEVKGKILSREDNQPVIYATLLLSGYPLGTVSDENGRFKIKIPAEITDPIIEVSFLGYKKAKINVDKVKNRELVIYLDKIAKELQEYHVIAEKTYRPKQLLRKALKNIKTNNPQDTFMFKAYYRETVKENGVYIKYADATCDFKYSPYSNDNYKKKDYTSTRGTGRTITSFNWNYGARMHRLHFWHSTLRADQLVIEESRSSKNLSKRNMEANIEGGPIGLLAKDMLKYQQAFLDKKSQYHYELKDELDSISDQWVYVIYFSPKTADGAEKKKISWRKANRHNLKGKIIIERNNLAIRSIEYSVHRNLRPHFCGFDAMNIKHTDYLVKLDYEQKDSIYYLSRVKQQNEFMYNDTAKNIITPYDATLELFVTDIETDSLYAFEKTELFENVDQNQLFDYPLSYDSVYWKTYLNKHVEFEIPENIRTDMNVEMPLEKQFHYKHIKDTSLAPPLAKKIPSGYKIHGQKVQDNYAWMKDTVSPISNDSLISYLQAENKYADNYFIPLRQSQRDIFNFMMLFVEKTTTSLPREEEGYYYYHKYISDDEYQIYYRKPVNDTTKEEVILDVNQMAEGKEYYEVPGILPSPDNKLLMFAENTTGGVNFNVKFKKLPSGELLNDSLINPGSIFWIDNKTLIYSLYEKKTLRPYKIYLHKLNTPQSEDIELFHETDPEFNVHVRKSKSKAYVFIESSGNASSEVRFLKINHPLMPLKLIAPREEDHEYFIEHHKDKFYIRSNKGSLHARIAVTDTGKYNPENWETLVPDDDNILLYSFELFDNYIAINEKENAQARIRIIDLRSKEPHIIKFKKDIFHGGIAYNPNFNTDTLQISYNAPDEPYIIYNYHMGSREKRTVKKSGISRIRFRAIKVDRVWATARDGTKIPVTLIYNKYRLKQSKKNPEKSKMYITGYGAYGAGQNPSFNPAIISLVSNGFVVAMPHIRGGDDMGKQWYLDGKMSNKMNTFTDFIDCTEYLIAEGYARKGRIIAEGTSAGGLLMGVVANMRPDLYKAIFLNVPFVDIMNTMLDDKLPLTTGEYKEWGNPNKKKEFEYMMSYSPYDNVSRQDYTNMFFFTGLNDTQVPYWEPAKMTAKLREYKTDDNVLLLKTNLYSGHGGESGRFSSYQQSSYKQAIMFDLLK